MTEKLYYIDSHTKEFTATVISCVPGKHGWDVVLDRTAFYPEGGGQPGDQGFLDRAAVTDTHEKDGQIVHYCDQPLPVGAAVTGTLDWDRRFQLMQQHSGEHMVSGLIHAAFGYNNVGFHMGRDAVTIDFDGVITEQQLQEIEHRVNDAVWQNLPVEILHPNAEERKHLPYRSKKELTGDIRIVHFPHIDLCACCGTHVRSTGEIGLVKLLSCVRFHSGVRIEMLAGGRALACLCAAWEQNRQISGLLSAKPEQTAGAVSRIRQELSDTKLRVSRLEDRLFRQKAETFRNAGSVLLFEEGLNPDSLRRLADAVLRTCGGRCAVFSPVADGFQYAIGQDGGDLRAFTRQMNQALNGRGGGKPGFVQGSVRADQDSIRQFFAAADRPEGSV